MGVINVSKKKNKTQNHQQKNGYCDQMNKANPYSHDKADQHSSHE